MRELVDWITKELNKDGLSTELNGVGDLSIMEALDVYRNDYIARLTGAIGENYKSIWFYLGDENFHALCREYINTYLSHSFDLDDYGEYMPEFLENSEWNQKHPYLFDLAKIERSFNDLFHNTNNTNNAIDPAQLDPERPLILSPLTAIFTSNHPIYSLYDIAQKENQDGLIDFSTSESMILFKREAEVLSAPLTHLQYRILLDVKEGKTFDEALADAPIDATDEITELFALLNHNGLLG